MICLFLLQHEDPDTGVSCWASSFEKLLDDPDGLQTFAVTNTNECLSIIL